MRTTSERRAGRKRTVIALAIGALAAWRPRRQTAATTPLETLQGRYARGDIDAQEFDRRRQALGGMA